MQVAPITAFQPTIQRPTEHVDAAAASRGTSDKASASQPAHHAATASHVQTTRTQPHRQAGAPESGQQTDDKPTNKSDTSEHTKAQHNKANGEALTEAELQQLDRLKQTDREVRQHEHAHQSTGGKFAAQASQHLMAARLELAMQQSEMDDARGAANGTHNENQNEYQNEPQQPSLSAAASSPSQPSARS